MPRHSPSKVAAALDYLERLKNQAAEFGGGVVENLADRARSVGGLAYEALTSDPNMGRMTTAEFNEAASRPTPRLDQAAQDLGTIGRAIVTQPIQTGKAIVQGEIDRAQEATTSLRAAGEYAGSFIDPMRIAAALRKTAPVLELDVYHGTPHRFPATEANPLGEFDASKIGTGEGAQAFGHGIYLAQKPEVAQDYQFMLSKIDPETVTYQGKPAQHWYDTAQAEQDRAHRLRDKTAIDRANAKLAYWENVMTRRHPEDVKRVANDPDDGWKTFADYANSLDMNKFGGVGEAGSLYKADLPDEMIDRMLDWDKPLSEQSAAVREALMKNPAVAAEIKRINAQREALNAQNPQRLTHPVISKLAKKETTAELLKGQALYELLAKGGNQAETSAYLRSLGIPGIRYLDAGSRDGGSGTRNFVVFPGEEKKVRILERDGQKAPPQKIAQALEAASTVSKKVTQKSLEKQLKAVDPNASLVKTVVFDGQGNRKPMYVARVNNKSVEIGSYLDDVEAWAQESLESFVNQRKAASINAELGLPETAQTGLWVVQGVDPQGNPFNMERAKKAAEKIRFRHEQTNYDDMLQQGISKEEARGDVTAMFNRLKASK